MRPAADRGGLAGCGGRADGGGLAGLFDRVRTVEGSLAVDSPQGGPTRVVVKLPMHV